MSGDKPEEGSDQPTPSDPVHQAYGAARGHVTSTGSGGVVYGHATDSVARVYLSPEASYTTGYFSTVTRDEEEIRRLLNDPLIRRLSNTLNEEAEAIKAGEDRKAEEEIRQLWDKMDKDIVELEARADRLLAALTR